MYIMIKILMESTHVLLSSFHLNGHTKGFPISLTDLKTLPCARQQTVNIIVGLEKLIVE